MTYQRSASAQKMVDAAHSKLIVYYWDGNSRTWWGRNGINGGRIAADPLGIELRRHQKYVSKNVASIKYAQIYIKNAAQPYQSYDGRKGCWL